MLERPVISPAEISPVANISTVRCRAEGPLR